MLELKFLEFSFYLVLKIICQKQNLVPGLHTMIFKMKM